MLEDTKMVPNRFLKQARELRGWSQARVARELGTDATTVSRWERGLFSPTPYFRERLCVLFTMNTQELGLLERSYEQEEHREATPEVTLSEPPLALLTQEKLGETRNRSGQLLELAPPHWSECADMFEYILLSAMHDQQAHM